MAGAPVQIEYVGFTASGPDRVYMLRVRQGGVTQDMTVAIPNEAFLARRVRYQDAPDVCFLKLQRELAAEGALASSRYTVSDQELEEYRLAHAPRPPARKPKGPPAA
jgi:hypothetical protein